MISKKKLDTFDSIVNSLRPIKYKFSNKSLQIDKYFNFLNLDELERRLQHKFKLRKTFHDSLLYKEIEKAYNLNSDFVEYFEDKNGIRKMPIKIAKIENILMNNLNVPDHRNKIKEYFFEEKEEQKKMIYKFRKELNKIKDLPSFGSDPGYYHPNYQFIFKRSPCFEFTKSINSQGLSEKKKNINDPNNNIPIIEKDIENNKEFEKKSNKTLLENYQSNNDMINKDILKMNICKNQKLLNITSRNRKIIKQSSTQRTLLPKIDLNKSKNVQKKSIIKKILEKKIQRKENSNTISFKRIKGRETYKSSNRIEGVINYKPNYESTFPHVPSFTFKNLDDKTVYKKYKVGKIIRNYSCDANKYFIFDFNNNQSKNKKPKNNKSFEDYLKFGIEKLTKKSTSI